MMILFNLVTYKYASYAVCQDALLNVKLTYGIKHC